MLSIQNLTVEYSRRGEAIPAVRDFSMDVQSGDAVGLVGESGSGKSTVAMAILRLIRPNEGRIVGGQVLFEGKDLALLPEDEMRRVRGREIAMVFQDPFTALNPVLRIRTQLAEGLEAHGETASSVRLAQALEQVQLEPERILNSFPHQISGGQRQRVMIASALLSKPKLILADEVTTALDVLVQKDILDLLFDLRQRLGVAVLFISHHLPLVANYTQRIVIMKDGQVVESGATSRVIHEPKTAYARDLWASVPRLRVGR